MLALQSTLRFPRAQKRRLKRSLRGRRKVSTPSPAASLAASLDAKLVLEEQEEANEACQQRVLDAEQAAVAQLTPPGAAADNLQAAGEALLEARIQSIHPI